MRVGISISPLPTRFGPVLHEGDLGGLCGSLAKAGYSGVELSLVAPEAFTPELASAVSGNGLVVFSIATGQSYIRDKLCLYTADARIREAAVNRLTGFFPLARKLGCPIIIGGVRGNEVPEAGEMARVQDLGDTAFRRLATLAATEGVNLLLEPINRYESRFFNTVDSGARFIAAAKLSNVKLLADTFHMNIEEADITATVQSHLNLIGYVHVADSNRLYPGAGHIDFRRLLSCLEANRYQGVIGVEVLPSPDPREAAMRSIQTLRQYVADRT